MNTHCLVPFVASKCKFPKGHIYIYIVYKFDSLSKFNREGNGKPLQYSCLENPMDGGAWWAAVHGVATSRPRLHFHFSLSCIGEGNGNPLQCSCLENPRDGRAWWAAVYGVAQSWTRLKRLSSSSSSKFKFITTCGWQQTWTQFPPLPVPIAHELLMKQEGFSSPFDSGWAWWLVLTKRV